MNKPWVFLDLDDTVFQSRRKILRDDPQSQVDVQTLEVGAVSPDGVANSFCLPHQHQLLTWLGETCHLVPTTCRSLQQFQRTTVKKFRFAVVNCGGVIIDSDGIVVRRWDAIMRPQLEALTGRLDQAWQEAREHFCDSADNVLIRTAKHDDLPCYLHVKDRLDRVDLVAELRQKFMSSEYAEVFSILHWEAQFFLMPRCLNKVNAVRWLADAIPIPPEDLKIGIGDNSTDIDFLNSCQFAMLPCHSDLWRQLWSQHPSTVISLP